MAVSKRFGLLAAVVLIFVFAATVYVTKVFITPMLLSFFFAIVLFPVYRHLQSHTGKKNLSAFLSILLVVFFFALFFFTAINAIVTEASGFLSSQKDITQSIDLYIAQKIEELFSMLHILLKNFVSESIALETIERLRESVEPFIEAPRSWNVSSMLPEIAGSAAYIASGFIGNLPIFMSQFFVAIMLTFYLLTDGLNAEKKLLLVLPERDLMSHFINELNKIYNNLFNVYLLTSLITGLFATIGFALFGVPYPFLWGLTTAIFALLPMIGPTIIFVPIAIYFILVQNYFAGVGLLIYGMVFINTVPENIIRPKLASQGADIHPSITLLAFAAPVFVVGVIGFIIGPLLYGFILAAFRTRVYMLKEEGAIDERDLAELSEEEKASPISLAPAGLSSKVKAAIKRVTRGRL